MKKTKFSLFAIVAVLLIATSCSYRMVERTGRTLEPYSEPMMADLEVSQTKVTGTFSVMKRELGRLRWNMASTRTNIYKLNAVYDALQSVKADVLLFPQYEYVKVEGAGSGIMVTVTGYPGVYRNFRPVPKAIKVNLTEMKPETPYLIETKDENGKTVGYKVVTNYKNNSLDLNDVTLDKVVVTKNSKKSRHE